MPRAERDGQGVVTQAKCLHRTYQKNIIMHHHNVVKNSKLFRIIITQPFRLGPGLPQSVVTLVVYIRQYKWATCESTEWVPILDPFCDQCNAIRTINYKPSPLPH